MGSKKRGHGEIASDEPSRPDGEHSAPRNLKSEERLNTPMLDSASIHGSNSLASKFNQLERALADVLAAKASEAEWTAALDSKDRASFVHTLKTLHLAGDMPWIDSAVSKAATQQLSAPPVSPSLPPQASALVALISASMNTSPELTKPSKWPPTLPPINNPALRSQAFTHPSWVDCHNPNSTSFGFENLHYQRLEFLGDAVLQYLMSKILFEHFPTHRENVLSALRTGFVNNKNLAEYARLYNLPSQVRLGTDGRDAGVDKNVKFAGDIFEAYLGALFLDSPNGLEVAEKFLRDLVSKKLLDDQQDVGDNFTVDKTAKQNLWLAVGGVKGVEIKYEWTGGGGGNNGGFWYTAKLNGYGYKGLELGKGWGNNKNDAQLRAAGIALQNTKLIAEIKAKKDEHIEKTKKEEFLQAQRIVSQVSGDATPGTGPDPFSFSF